MSTYTDTIDQSLSSSPTIGLTILHDVSWATYEQLLSDHEGRSSPRFTFDRGTLEIMSPSAEHEKCNRTIALFVELLAEELNIDVEDLGSTTFRRSDLARGFEPDSCFYIQNEARIRGKQEIDLSVDPPPDLVIEIDLTSRSLDKLPLYAQIGVPEIWRYDGRRFWIFGLTDGAYHKVEHSLTFPIITPTVIENFLAQARNSKRTALVQSFRSWVQGQQK